MKYKSGREMVHAERDKALNDLQVTREHIKELESQIRELQKEEKLICHDMLLYQKQRDEWKAKACSLEAKLERVRGLEGPECWDYDRTLSERDYETYTAGYNHGRNDAAVERQIALTEETPE